MAIKHMTKPIYLDYAATTPVDERVAAKMSQYLTQDGVFGNPASSTHPYGWDAQAAVDTARGQIASLIGGVSDGVIFTSGATEAINLALQGVMRFYHRRGNHMVTFATEHKATLDVAAFLERQGMKITFLKPDRFGKVDLKTLEAALTDQTVLVSCLHVNNELGTVQPLKEIGALTRERGILFHVDAAQSAGKIAINLDEMKIDLLSLSAHKIYGPKGIGALYVRQKPRIRLTPLLYGGGHEQGLRSGTLPTHQIVGMGEAFSIAQKQMIEDMTRIRVLRDQLLVGLEAIPDIHVNGDPETACPTILNVSFGGVDGEALLNALPDIAVASGSACASANVEPSHVLLGIGCTEQQARSALRFSMGRYTTEKEIENAAKSIGLVVKKLNMTP